MQRLPFTLGSRMHWQYFITDYRQKKKKKHQVALDCYLPHTHTSDVPLMIVWVTYFLLTCSQYYALTLSPVM